MAQQYAITHPVYVNVPSLEQGKKNIQEMIEQYGQGKYMNFVNRIDQETLEGLQKAFPQYNIVNTAGSGWSPYYEMTPK